MSISPGEIPTSNLQPKDIRKTRKIILEWGIENFKQYPWRITKNDWLGLVAEILLQRTRVKNVVPVYLEFEKEFPAPFLVTDESAKNVYKILYSLGLSWRASKIIELASILTEKRGEIPKIKRDLLNLPGVGEYVASAWLCFQANIPSVLIDNNVTRWVARYYGMLYSPESRRDKKFITLMKQLTPSSMPANKTFNYAVLDFTMNVCLKKPLCRFCPIIENCKYKT